MAISIDEHEVPRDAAYRNPSLTIDERIGDLLGRMTLQEKVGQMMQHDAHTKLEDAVLHQHVGSLLHVSPEHMNEAHDLVGRTRLQIPLIIGDDCIHGHSFFRGATIYPTQLAMACSWDAPLIERVARATAEEVAPTGIHWTFSPVVCISRDTRWGRVGETFGEDPVLIGELASAMVKGYQGGAGVGERLWSDAILATAKHFAGYSETQGGRDASEADLSHRKLLSWFLPPFERLANEGCATFMLGYESIDGVPVTINKWLLTDVLRGDWGYQGTLVTDWDNVGRMVYEQQVQPDYEHSAAAAVKAGDDLIMTTPGFYEGALQAVADGLITEADIDQAVTRILALKFRLGLFEDPRRPDLERQQAVIGSPEHQQLNLDIARESVVLLKNSGVLPLDGPRDGSVDTTAPTRIALVGPLADAPQTQLGDWAGGSGQCDWIHDQPRDMIETVLDGLKRLLPEHWELSHAVGAHIMGNASDPENVLDFSNPDFHFPSPAQPDADLIADAVHQAEGSDVVVAVVGDNAWLFGENRSTATLELIGGQKALLDALAATGKPLVVVVMSSKPLVLPDSVRSAAAILWAPSPGMRGGRAIAEILLGLTQPSGRLPITFPRHAGQLPIYYNQIRGQHGNRYADLTQDPAFAFGEGLGYTTFSYADPVLDCEATVGRDDHIVFHVDVTNTGERSGIETVQVYSSDVVTSVSWAERELKAWKRVRLEAGETQSVRFDIPVSDLTIVNAEGDRVVEPGAFDILVGHSSRLGDLKTTRVTVENRE